MSLLDIFRRKSATPLPPQVIVSKKLSGQVDKDNKLSLEATSLDEFYSTQRWRDDAQRLFNLASNAQSLKALDGTEQDFDQRPGHVIVPQENFQYNSDTGTFQLTKDRPHGYFEVNGETGQIAVTYHEKEYETAPPDYFATWNTSDNSFNYQCDVVESKYDVAWFTGTEYPMGALVEEQSFQVDASGRFQRPHASSLEEAKELLSSEFLARGQRAEELIQSATDWHHRAQALDGELEVDLNPRAQVTVAAKLYIADARSNEWDDPLLEWDPRPETVDLESDPNKLFVASYNYGDPVTLRASFQEGDMELTLRDFVKESTEKLTWSKTDGKVHYQKFEMKNSLLSDLRKKR